MKPYAVGAIIIVFMVGGIAFFLPLYDPSGSEVKPEADPLTVKEKQPYSIEDHITVPILIYHNIREVTEDDSSNERTFVVSPEKLEEQFAYLAEQEFVPISFQNLHDHFKGSFPLPEKPVIISFDDGTPGQYTHALPLLKQYHLTATFFIFTNPLGRSENYLTWDELSEIAGAGMEIGSHTWYHPYLTEVEDEARLQKEIVGSKEILEEQLGVAVSAIAYPFGEYTDAIVNAAETAGYTVGRGITNGAVHTKEDLMTLDGYFVTENFARFKNIIE